MVNKANKFPFCPLVDKKVQDIECVETKIVLMVLLIFILCQKSLKRKRTTLISVKHVNIMNTDNEMIG